MDKLILVQSELKCPKGNINKFGNYRYRSAEDILEALKPLLAKYNSMLTMTDDIVMIGSKYFLKATACFTSGDNSVCVNGFAELGEHKGMSSEQATGTASSYARKYALNGLFLIDETEQDADHDNKQQPKQDTKEDTSENKKTISDYWFKQAIERITNGEKTLIDKLKKDFNLTVEQLNKLNSCK